MSDLTQTLGLDASSALASLTSLNGAFASFESAMNRTAATMREFNSAGSKTSTLLNRLAASATKVNTSLSSLSAGPATTAFTKLGTASTTAGAKVATGSQSIVASNVASVASINKLTTSAQLLSRVVFTQAIVRGLNTLRRGFQETAQAAIDFQRQISRNLTIAGPGATTDQLKTSVQNLSTEFNIPLLEAAQGQYRALSDQVAAAGAELDFFNAEAAKFSKSTGASLSEAIDLGSAAMKSYGLAATDADKILGDFFKTLELGRAKASSLANSFGQVGPVGAALGLSLQEVLGAQAAISIQGTNTEQSLTALRGIMIALLKPTRDMKTALANNGFSTGEMAVRTLGLAGTLRVLDAAADGNVETLGKMFNRIRGLTGATALTGDDLRTLADDVDKVSNAERTLNDSNYLKTQATDAEKVTKEFNKMKVALTTGLGQDLLKGTEALLQYAGGADAITGATKAATPAIEGLAGALLLLQGRMFAVNAGATGLARALGPLAGVVLAYQGGKTLGGFLSNKQTEATLAPIKQLEKANADSLAAYKQQLTAAKDAGDKSNAERLKSALSFTQGLNKNYLKQEADLKATNKVFDSLSKKSKLTPSQSYQLALARQTTLNQPNPLAGVQGITQLEAALGRAIKTPDQLSKALVDADKRAIKLRQDLVQAMSVQPQADALQKEISKVFDQIDKKSNARNSFGGQFSDALRSQFAQVDTMFKQATADGKVTQEEFNQLVEARNKFGTNALAGENPFVGRLQFGSTIELLDQALAKMQALSKLPVANIAPIAAELQTLNSAMGNFAAQLQAGVGSSAAIASNLERAAEAAQKSSGAGAVEGHAKGGLISYYAGGGFTPRGTDTIPAMLSPGEFVVNAAATRQFYSQLTAINSGRQPIYRAEGGPTNNVSFSGDINVIENGSGKDTARQLMDQVRRELRRTTGRI